jgi:hypothetical protein
LVSPFISQNIIKTLRSLKISRSAPGEDKTTYDDLIRGDPTGKVLAIIFNLCLAMARVPKNWKNATTILLYKKGDENDIANWRPIGITNTIYRLYTSLLSRRLTPFLSSLLSPEQKGFAPVEGCAEHVYVLDTILNDAMKGKKRTLSLAWLDLANAFPSISHDLITEMMKKLGLPSHFIQTVQDFYTGATTVLKTGDEISKPVSIKAGVKQGDPLSPFLFNIAFEYILRQVKENFGFCGYELFGKSYPFLCYADDLVLISESPQSMEAILDYVSLLADKVKLTFRPKKCASLTLVKGESINYQFSIQNSPFPQMSYSEAYDYLGIPLGVGVDQTPVTKLHTSIQDMGKIAFSHLAPTQKLEALRLFIAPRLSYHLRLGEVRKAALTEYDNAMKKAVREICRLPKSASESYIFSDVRNGGLGFMPAKTDFEILSIAHAFKLLSSDDPLISNLAHDSLSQTVINLRPLDYLGNEPSLQDLCDFLNSEGNFKDVTSRSSNLWTKIRAHLRTLRKTFMSYERKKRVLNNQLFEVRFCIDSLNQWNLAIEHPAHENLRIAPEARRFAYRYLRTGFLYKMSQSFKMMDTQGACASMISKDRASNQFISDNRFISYAGFRFLHKARLNLTYELNGVGVGWKKKKNSDHYEECRRCDSKEPESLTHVLNCCEYNLGRRITDRHNAVLDRLVYSIGQKHPDWELKVNKATKNPNSTGLLRPDLVATDHERKRIFIIDVTCPSERISDNFSTARNHKILKYKKEADDMAQQTGYSVCLDGLLVGSLGTWDPNNDPILLKMGFSKSYLHGLKRRIVRDVIHYSAATFWSHIIGENYNDPKFRASLQ